MTEVTAPEGFKKQKDGSFHKNVDGEVLKIRLTSGAGYKKCPGKDCQWHITKKQCPVCDATIKGTKTTKSVSKEDIAILAKLTRDVIEGKTTEKPKNSKPTP